MLSENEFFVAFYSPILERSQFYSRGVCRSVFTFIIITTIIFIFIILLF